MARLPQYRRQQIAQTMNSPVKDDSADIVANAVLQATSSMGATAAQLGSQYNRVVNNQAANSFYSVNQEIRTAQRALVIQEAAQQKLMDEGMLSHHVNEFQRQQIASQRQGQEASKDVPMGFAKRFDQEYGSAAANYMANNPDLASRPEILAKFKAKADDLQTAYYRSNTDWELDQQHKNLVSYADADVSQIITDAGNARSEAELAKVHGRYQELMGTPEAPGLYRIAYGNAKATEDMKKHEKAMAKGFLLNVSQIDPKGTIKALDEPTTGADGQPTTGRYSAFLDAEDTKAIRSAAETKIKADEIAQMKAVERANYQNIQGWRSQYGGLNKVSPLQATNEISAFIRDSEQEMQRMTALPRDQFNEQDYKEIQSMHDSASTLLRTAGADMRREDAAIRANNIAEQQRLDDLKREKKEKATDFTKTDGSLKIRSALRASKENLYKASIGQDPTVQLADVQKFQSALWDAKNNGHFYGKDATFEAQDAFATALASRLMSDKPAELSPAEKIMSMIIKPPPGEVLDKKFFLSQEDVANQFTAIKQAGVNVFRKKNGRDPEDGELSNIEAEATKIFLNLKEPGQ